ncbi:MAG: YgeY family selenium metabolism-linked hydrolase [PVC group bacterium]
MRTREQLDKQGLTPDMVRFLREIVAIPSPSGGEGAVLERIAAEMAKTGWEEIHYDGIGNLLGKIGSGEHALAIDAHADTVGPGAIADWGCDPYQGLERDGWVWGRGTVDQKGGVVAAVYAGRLIGEQGLPADCTLHLVISIQEENCEGLCWDHLIVKEKFRPEGVILTEPTGLTIKRGQLGHLEMAVTAAGRSAHAFCPEKGENAIYRMTPLIGRIREIAPRLHSHPAFGRGRISITDIRSGSPSGNSVPDTCRILIDRRFCPQETEENLRDEIRALFDDAHFEITVPIYRELSHRGALLEGRKFFPGWVTDEESPLVGSARETLTLIGGGNTGCRHLGVQHQRGEHDGEARHFHDRLRTGKRGTGPSARRAGPDRASADGLFFLCPAPERILPPLIFPSGK